MGLNAWTMGSSPFALAIPLVVIWLHDYCCFWRHWYVSCFLLHLFLFGIGLRSLNDMIHFLTISTVVLDACLGIALVTIGFMLGNPMLVAVAMILTPGVLHTLFPQFHISDFGIIACTIAIFIWSALNESTTIWWLITLSFPTLLISLKYLSSHYFPIFNDKKCKDKGLDRLNIYIYIKRATNKYKGKVKLFLNLFSFL